MNTALHISNYTLMLTHNLVQYENLDACKWSCGETCSEWDHTCYCQREPSSIESSKHTLVISTSLAYFESYSKNTMWTLLDMLLLVATYQSPEASIQRHSLKTGSLEAFSQSTHSISPLVIVSRSQSVELHLPLGVG